MDLFRLSRNFKEKYGPGTTDRITISGTYWRNGKKPEFATGLQGEKEMDTDTFRPFRLASETVPV